MLVQFPSLRPGQDAHQPAAREVRVLADQGTLADFLPQSRPRSIGGCRNFDRASCPVGVSDPQVVHARSGAVVVQFDYAAWQRGADAY